MAIQQMLLGIGPGEVPFNLPTWSTVDSGWTASNNDHDGDFSGSGYSHIITSALTDGTTYRFFLERYVPSSYGGWFFTDTTSPSNTVPDEFSGNSLGQRKGESDAGAYGSYATANSVSAGQGAFNNWDSIEDATVIIEFVVNRTVDKVWMRKKNDASWLEGGDPNNTSSTPTFNIPGGEDTIYFGCVEHSGSGGYANFSDS